MAINLTYESDFLWSLESVWVKRLKMFKCDKKLVNISGIFFKNLIQQCFCNYIPILLRAVAMLLYEWFKFVHAPPF